MGKGLNPFPNSYSKTNYKTFKEKWWVVLEVFKKTKSEDGISTLGFVSTLGTIVLCGFAIVTFNINEAQAKVDKSVEFDIKNIAAQTNLKLANEKTVVPIDNKYIGSNELGLPISETSPISKGTVITASGDSKGYCLFASNPAGESSDENRYVYASNEGGFHILYDGQNCKDGAIKTLIADQ